jgi:choline-glycine betaine transporter
MHGLRYFICALVAAVFGAVTFAGVGATGLSSMADPTGGLYSNLVIYPAVILMMCFGFWIVFSATDPGTGK